MPVSAGLINTDGVTAVAAAVDDGGTTAVAGAVAVPFFKSKYLYLPADIRWDHALMIMRGMVMMNDVTYHRLIRTHWT